MVRLLLLSFLAIGVITAGQALAQNSSDDLQVFEFDYDQQIEAPTLGMPSKTTSKANSGTSIAAPARQAEATSKDVVITIIGEPDPPSKAMATNDEDLITDLFGPLAGQSEEVILTTPGSPQTTRVPAGPGEARVEKSAPAKTVKPKAVPKVKTQTAKSKTLPSGRPTAARTPTRIIENVAQWPDDADLRRWAMATVNWSRVAPTSAWPEPVSIVDGRPLYPIDQAPYPGPARRTAVSAGESDDGCQP